MKILLAVLSLVAILDFGLPAGARAGSALSVGGLGEPYLEEPARLRAMGGAGAAERGPRRFSLVNPASAAEVEHLILEGTVLPAMRRVTSGAGETESSRETTLPSIRALIRLPGAIVLGGAYVVGTNARFGIDRAESSGASSTLRIDGTGGMDLVRITAARRVSPLLNLGIDYEVIAGSLREDWVRDFADPSFETTRDTLETSWERQGHWRFGAQLHHAGWSLGGVYETARRLPLTTTQRTAGTIVRREHESLTIPDGFTVGAAGALSERFRLAAQYRRANWSRESLQSDLVDFRALERWSFGFEWQRSAGGASLWSRLPLRAGVSLLQWPDLLVPVGGVDVSGGGVGVKEWAVSLGTGIASQDRGGSVDLSIEAGSRGDADELGIRERFVRVGVTLQVSDDTWK